MAASFKPNHLAMVAPYWSSETEGIGTPRVPESLGPACHLSVGVSRSGETVTVAGLGSAIGAV